MKKDELWGAPKLPHNYYGNTGKGLKNSYTRVFVQPGIFIFPEFFSGYDLRTNKNCRFFVSTEYLFPVILFEYSVFKQISIFFKFSVE